MKVDFDQAKEPTASPENPETDIELKEYETRLGFLYDIAHQASSTAEVTDLLEGIPYMFQQILGASASSLLLIDEEEKQFCLRVTRSDNSKLLEQTKIGLDSGIAGFVALNSQSVIINDVSLDKIYSKDVDEVSGLDTKSIIATPLVRGSKVIGVLEMMNKKNGGPFDDRDLGLLTYFSSTEAFILLISMATILVNNFKLCQKIQSEYKSTVEVLVSYADAKDPYAHGHSRRVKEYSVLAANALKLSPEELRLIEFGALLHDVGKIGIDDRILRKTGGLSTEEWYIIRKHALKGANIVRLIPNLEKITDFILYHHERYDGKGYPEGLKDEQIPLGARIIAVADAFDTMTTDRAYRSAMSFDKAIKELLKHRGEQFCPRVVDAFVAQLREQKDAPVIKESRAAIDNLLIQEIEDSVKQESIAVRRGEPPSPDKATVQDVEKDIKQEKTPIDAENNPAADMALKQFVEEMTRQDTVTENNEGDLKAEAVLNQLIEEAAEQDGSAESLKDKSSTGEIGRGKTNDNRKRKNNQKLAEKEAKRKAKEKAKKETLLAKEAKNKAKEEAKKKIVQAGKTKSAAKRNYDIKSTIFKGDVQLAIIPFISFRKISQFKKCLLTMDGVKVGSERWSEDEGFILSILLQAPMNLWHVLQSITDVQEVFQEGPRIVVVLKTCDEEKTSELVST